MSLPQQVKIVEVGPRDGLQNEKQSISLEDKLKLIDMLACAGLTEIEATSFVSPKWVPQMGDHGELMKNLKRHPNVAYPVLVPNLKGLEAALEAEVKEIAVFAAASESFSKKNTNCSIAESLERLSQVMEIALKQNIRVRGCPYEGNIPLKNIQHVAKTLHDAGCYEISLGDTIGVGTPLQVQHIFSELAKDIPITQLAAHFHNTYGQALANILSAIQLGVCTVDASISGLGGCPYAKGATGNVATEDVVYMLQGMEIQTGIDLDKLIQCGIFIDSILGRNTQSNVANALRKAQ